MIWDHLYNLKNVKNNHGGMLPLVKLQVEGCNFTKSNTSMGVFSCFFNSTSGTKSHKASHKRLQTNFALIFYITNKYRK